MEQQRSPQRSAIRRRTAVREVSSVMCRAYFAGFEQKKSSCVIFRQRLHRALITARGRGCSTWGGMLNSRKKSIALRIKSFRHRIQWILSACTNTAVGSAYTELKSWPIPSDSHNISPSSSLSLSVCHRRVSAVTFMAAWRTVLHPRFDPRSQEKACCSLPQTWQFASHLLTTFHRGHVKKRNVKLHTSLQKQ